MHLELTSWTDAAVAQLVQVTLLAIVVGIVVLLTARIRPHLAYLLWMLVIVKCLTPPIAASRTSVFSWAWAERSPVVEEPSGPASPAIQPTAEAPALIDSLSLDKNPGTEKAPSQREAAKAEEPAGRKFSAAELLWGFWGFGAFLLAGYISVKWVLFRRAVKRAYAATPAWLVKRVAQLTVEVGLWRTPKVALATDAMGPLSMGVWRPTIVLPADLIEDANNPGLDPILAHELLHLKRGDVFFGHLQLVAQVVWWFHPLIWWANREARRERERSCDEAVLALLSCKPADYARALIDVLDLRQRFSRAILLPVASAADLNARRIRHIMHPAARFHRRTPRWCSLILACAAVLSLPGAGLSLEAADDGSNARSEGEPIDVNTAEKRQTAESAEAKKPNNANEISGEFVPAFKLNSSVAEPKDFSAKHNAAAKRLQELGTYYSATTKAQTKRPYVMVSIPSNWKGAADDWRLLADLDVVTQLNVDVVAGEEENLDVITDIESLETLGLTSPTAPALEKASRLKGLTSLFLDNHGNDQVELTADEFAPVAKLSQLIHLVISRLPIGDDALKHLAQLRQVATLHLDNLPITDEGIAALATMDRLQKLYVSSSPWKNEPAATKVTGTGFAALARLPDLKILSLHGTNVTDEGLAGVAELEGLEQLLLSHANSVTAEGISALAKMHGLKRLMIEGPKLNGDGFAPLAGLTNLRSLVIYGDADLGDAGARHVAHLGKLRQLITPGRGLTERGLFHLAGLRELRVLTLPEAKLSAGVLDRLAELPKLKILKFDAQFVDDEVVDELRALPGLEGLSLAGSRITDKGLAELAGDDRYQYLNLKRTAISDGGLGALADLNNLTSLDLSGTRITDDGLEKLEQVKSLTSLDVIDTKVTEEGVKKLAKAMSQLESLRSNFGGANTWTVFHLEIEPDEEILGDEKQVEKPDEDLRYQP